MAKPRTRQIWRFLKVNRVQWNTWTLQQHVWGGIFQWSLSWSVTCSSPYWKLYSLPLFSWEIILLKRPPPPHEWVPLIFRPFCQTHVSHFPLIPFTHFQFLEWKSIFRIMFCVLLHPTMNYAYENQVHICFITSVIPTSWLKCGSIIDFTLKICYTLLVILKHLLNIKVLCCVWMLVPLTIIMSKMFVVPSFL